VPWGLAFETWDPPGKGSGAILHLQKNRNKARMTLCGMIILFALAPLLCLGQNPDTKTLRSEPPSDRVRSGMRGPVKICVQQTTYPTVTASDGTQIPERTQWTQTEYDQEGHLVSTRNRNSDDSVYMVRNTYASGKLLKTTSGKVGEPPAVTAYAYDDPGRITSITDPGAPDNPITFRYDEHGRKTKVQISRAEDYRANVGVAGSPFEAADRGPNLPGGGTTITTYDENDRPTQAQVRDAQGAELSRTLRVYDEQGRVTEEKQILDDPLNLIPADMRAKILAESGASGAELREQLTKFLGGHEGPSSVAYSYDAQNRVKETRRRIFNRDETIETTYNEQGDEATQITRSLPGSNEQEPNLPGENSEVRYAYQYDEHGNWTEKVTSYASDPGSTFQPSDTIRRTLTYF
jgi:YD repeat-containing protein